MAVRFATLSSRYHPATQQVCVHVRYGIEGHVTNDDLICWMGSLPLVDKLLGQLARNRLLLAGAAFDD